jgi:hypothetical protein
MSFSCFAMARRADLLVDLLTARVVLRQRRKREKGSEAQESDDQTGRQVDAGRHSQATLIHG